MAFRKGQCLIWNRSLDLGAYGDGFRGEHGPFTYDSSLPRRLGLILLADGDGKTFAVRKSSVRPCIRGESQWPRPKAP